MTIERDPAEFVADLAGAYVGSRCLHAVANLGVADAIGEVPRPLVEVARECGCDAGALERVMRHLASLGIFTAQDGGFGHNACSRTLRSDEASGVLALTRLLALPILWNSFGVLEQSVTTGRPGAESQDPDGLFRYLDRHPEESRLYDAGMTGMTVRRIPQLVPSYDFSGFDVIADIGGGRGHLLRAVLDRTATATGILVDRPQVLDHAERHDRMTLWPGSFFTDPLPEADCYLLSNIVHDWGDTEAMAILAAVRAAAREDSSLLLFEFVVPDDGGAFEATDIDVYMLALVSGRERTLAEYERLLTAAGWALARTIETESQTIIEAKAG